MEYLTTWSSGDLLVSGAFVIFAMLILTSVYFNLKRAISGVRMTASTKSKRRPARTRSTRLDANTSPVYPHSDQVVGGARKVQPNERYVLEPNFESLEDIHEHAYIEKEIVVDDQEVAAESTEAYELEDKASVNVLNEALDFSTDLANIEEPTEADDAYQSLAVFAEHYENDASTETEASWDELATDHEYETENQFESTELEPQEPEYQTAEADYVEDEYVSVHAGNEFEDSASEDYEPALQSAEPPAEIAEDLTMSTLESEPEPVLEQAYSAGESLPGSKDFVVSVCLLFEHQGRFFRQIRGEKLNEFLRKRRFVLLNNEFHLQTNSMVDEGGIRVRNYYRESIGELIKDGTTVGFRMYFVPHRCKNPEAMLSEMLQIANSAVQYFDNQLEIYDGVLSQNGKLKKLSRQRYEDIKSKLLADFPQVRHQAAPSLRERLIEPSRYLPEANMNQAMA